MLIGEERTLEVRNRSRRSRPKTGSNSRPTASASPRRSTLFGPPLLLEGEDAAVYDQLLERIYVEIKPVDVIDEMLIADVASLEWEVLRWRRLKFSFFRSLRLAALERFLGRNVGDEYWAESFKSDLAEILRDRLPKDQPKAATDLASRYVADEPAAVHRVGTLLNGTGTDIEQVRTAARAREVKELVQDYARREPYAVECISEFLTEFGKSLDDLTAAALTDKVYGNLDHIARIDSLTTIAEGRRNATLREIDRRRTALAATLRRNVQQIEDAEFQVLEASPAKGKNAH
jgi:hypothetical protein